MTREQKLDILLLLSAMESWSFSMQKPLPDYLREQVATVSKLLSNEVIDGCS